jgi:hypothetical protein
MKDYPQFLHDDELNKLEKSGDIIYFRYINREILNSVKSILTEDEMEILSKGDSHALVGKALYLKVYDFKENKILKTKSIELEVRDGEIKLFADCIYVPKGREYFLIDDKFIS